MRVPALDRVGLAWATPPAHDGTGTADMTRTRHAARRASLSQDGLARSSRLDTLRQYCLDRADDEERSTDVG